MADGDRGGLDTSAANAQSDGPSVSRTASPQRLCGVPVKDESYCQCPQQPHNRELTCRCGEDNTGLEWVWDLRSKSPACELSHDNREVRFHVNYSSGTAGAMGTKAMRERQHFWEIKMTTPVYGTDIMVGVGTAAVDLNAFRYSFCSLLGKDGESWGYSYFGRSQHKGDFNMMPGARFGQGSIIGVHLDMWHGHISLYKNRQPLGCVYGGLSSKVLYPMVCSTAARTGLRLITSTSFSTSLQFLCCQMLRRLVPAHLHVVDALTLPPGLSSYLIKNLSWLLRPHQDSASSRKRQHMCMSDSTTLSQSALYEKSALSNPAPKRRRSHQQHDSSSV